ncbi:hypothetical protein IMSAGC019_03439 [Lachnospiraceae bacterium]|nr:hypothetical protein IMSAGC019_03439 [Lachnospiraceae bacterium]
MGAVKQDSGKIEEVSWETMVLPFFAFRERSDLCPAACGGDIRSKSEILKPIFDWLC